MSQQELTPLQVKIKSIIKDMTQEEPYITNVAIRISRLMPRNLQDITGEELKIMLKETKKLGYANGYTTAKRKYGQIVKGGSDD